MKIGACEIEDRRIEMGKPEGLECRQPGMQPAECQHLKKNRHVVVEQLCITTHFQIFKLSHSSVFKRHIIKNFKGHNERRLTSKKQCYVMFYRLNNILFACQYSLLYYFVTMYF
jgi:hypothetical protein